MNAGVPHGGSAADTAGASSGGASAAPRIDVAVRYFASLREALGAGEVIQVAAGSTVGDVRRDLAARSPEHAAALGPERVLRSALDQVLCDEAAVVGAGAEVGFFPPVTGG